MVMAAGEERKPTESTASRDPEETDETLDA